VSLPPPQRYTPVSCGGFFCALKFSPIRTDNIFAAALFPGAALNLPNRRKMTSHHLAAFFLRCWLLPCGSSDASNPPAPAATLLDQFSAPIISNVSKVASP